MHGKIQKPSLLSWKQTEHSHWSGLLSPKGTILNTCGENGDARATGLTILPHGRGEGFFNDTGLLAALCNV